MPSVNIPKFEWNIKVPDIGSLGDLKGIKLNKLELPEWKLSGDMFACVGKGMSRLCIPPDKRKPR